MKTRRNGFSLIELMIAVTLGMLSIAAVGSVFVYGSRNYKQDDKISRMQDELRFAMAQLTQDLEMAGFWAQIRNPVQDIEIHGSATVSNDCGPAPPSPPAGQTWTYNERRAGIATLGNATASAANADFPCVTEAEFVPGTDIIAIKRLAGSSIASPAKNQIYLRTNGVQSTLYKHNTEGTAPAPAGTLCPAANCSVTIYEYRPVVWYIRKYAVATQSPAVPSLCRKFLEGGDAPSMTTECLAQGITDMQLEFGFDNNADGVADYFEEYNAMQDPEAVLSRIVAVRVHLLARSSESDGGYVNKKTYQLASQTHLPINDGFYRIALSTTVSLRNQTARLSPYSLPSG